MDRDASTWLGLTRMQSASVPAEDLKHQLCARLQEHVKGQTLIAVGGAQIVPSCASTIERQIDSPMPMRLGFVE
jgi:hypothetical protein